MNVATAYSPQSTEIQVSLPTHPLILEQALAIRTSMIRPLAQFPIRLAGELVSENSDSPEMNHPSETTLNLDAQVKAFLSVWKAGYPFREEPRHFNSILREAFREFRTEEELKRHGSPFIELGAGATLGLLQLLNDNIAEDGNRIQVWRLRSMPPVTTAPVASKHWYRILLVPISAIALAAQVPINPIPITPQVVEQARTDTRQAFYAALKSFQTSDIPNRLNVARKSIDTQLEALFNQHDAALSADADPDLPRDGALKVLFVRLYTIVRLGGNLSLPEGLKADFENLKQLEDQATLEMSRTEDFLFPPVVDSHNPSPWSAKELKTAYAQFVKVRNRWRDALTDKAPHLQLEDGLTDQWETTVKWFVSMVVAQEADGTIHIGQLESRTTGTLIYHPVIHRRFKHFVLKNGELRLMHDPIEGDNIKIGIHIDLGGAGPKIPEYAPIEDQDFPKQPIAPQDLPPILRHGPPPPAAAPPHFASRAA